MNMEAAVNEVRYVDCVEAAKLIRKALTRTFPGRKFSVTSERFAGGSAIDIRWTDGPTEAQVDKITRGYKGGGFDGMIDMAYSSESWLLPDGSAVFASTRGTESSKGTVPEQIASPPHPDAELVRFSAKYVHGQRKLSGEWRTQLEDEIATAAGEPFGNNTRLAVFVRDGEVFPIDGTDEYGSQLVWQLSSQREVLAHL